MNCTDYLLSILEAYPFTASIWLQPGATFDPAAIPDGVTVERWEEQYSQADDADGYVLVRFNV
jgi:hypothetical protein